ncbi:MAG: hypothetical protein WCI04_06310 [archaeon]
MRKILIITIIILLVVGLLSFYFYSQSVKLDQCGEKKVVLEGTAIIIKDKYSISVLETVDKNYWIYGFYAYPDCPTCGAPIGFDDVIGKKIKIEGILSPAVSKGDDPTCNVCIRNCSTCQCPMGELLYEVKILEVLN